MAEMKDSILDKVQGSVERLQRSIRKEEETCSLLQSRIVALESSFNFSKQTQSEKSDSLLQSIKSLIDEQAQIGKLTTTLTIDISCLQKDQTRIQESFGNL